MTFLELLRQDCEDLELVRLGRMRGSDAKPVPEPLSPLLFTAHQELMSVGILVAVCGTFANLLQSNELDAAEARSLFICFIPQQGVLQSQFSQSLAINEPTLAAAFVEADNRLKFARRVTDSWVRPDAASISPFIEIAVLADVWQRTCAAIIEADRTLNAIVPNILLQTDGGVANQTRAALAEAADGGAACIDQYGKLSVPGWAERRASGRQCCDYDAIVSFPGGAMNCKVVNISETGFQISRLTEKVPAGEFNLMIERRALKGSIVWQREIGRAHV